jgi:hypothetical protein
MRRKRWRRGTISIAASLLAHLALLSPLLWMAPSFRMRPVANRPDLQIDLVRSVDLNPRAPHPNPPAETASAKETAQRPPPKASAQAFATLARPPQAPPPAANGAVAAQTGSAAGDAAVRAALRGAVGCSNPDFVGLTQAERAACRDRLRQGAEAMGEATVDPIRSIHKRAYYDEVKDARDAMNSYNPVNGPMPGNGPGFGCKHGKCGFIPPSGALTEEWGIKPP